MGNKETVTRRDFLKITGAAAGSVALRGRTLEFLLGVINDLEMQGIMRSLYPSIGKVEPVFSDPEDAVYKVLSHLVDSKEVAPTDPIYVATVKKAGEPGKAVAFYLYGDKKIAAGIEAKTAYSMTNRGWTIVGMRPIGSQFVPPDAANIDLTPETGNLNDNRITARMVLPRDVVAGVVNDPDLGPPAMSFKYGHGDGARVVTGEMQQNISGQLAMADVIRSGLEITPTGEIKATPRNVDETGKYPEILKPITRLELRKVIGDKIPSLTLPNGKIIGNAPMADNIITKKTKLSFVGYSVSYEVSDLVFIGRAGELKPLKEDNSALEFNLYLMDTKGDIDPNRKIKAVVGRQEQNHQLLRPNVTSLVTNEFISYSLRKDMIEKFLKPGDLTAITFFNLPDWEIMKKRGEYRVYKAVTKWLSEPASQFNCNLVDCWVNFNGISSVSLLKTFGAVGN